MNTEDIDNEIIQKIEEYNTTHPICPRCGSNMYEEMETYNLDYSVYIDKWYECPKCGHCIKI